MGSKSMDQWRDYFRTARGDIFDVIKNGITLAASDFPERFRFERDNIVEKLYTCQLRNTKKNCNGNCKSKEQVASQVSSSVNDNGDVNLNHSNDYSYHDAKATTAKIDEDSQLVREVLWIKELLFNSEDQSEDVVIESLERLQMMSLTVETLQETTIGKAVSPLRKHKSKLISNFARSLLREWKDVVDRWIHAVPDIKGGEDSADSGHPRGVQEGLPSPPLDEGTFFATQTAPIEFSKCVEGMDDNGNVKNGGEFNLEHLNKTKSVPQNQRIPMKTLSPHEVNIGAMENKGEDMRRNDSRNKQKKVSNTDVGLIKAPKSRNEVGNETKLQKKLNTADTQKMSFSGPQHRSVFLNGEDQTKIEAARRKLDSGCQQAEHAKKQRAVQVMELQELPKQGLGTGHPRPKPGSHNKNFLRGPR